MCANKWFILNSIISIRLEYLKSFSCVQQMSFGFLKNPTNKQDLASNNQKRLICLKTK